jgi:hypothetical protein
VGSSGGVGAYPPAFVYHYFCKAAKNEWNYPDGSRATSSASAKTKQTLYTGGKARIKHKNVHGLSVTAVEYFAPSDPAWMHTRSELVAPEWIQVMGLTPRTNYIVYKILPENVVVDATVRVIGSDHFNATLTDTKYRSYFHLYVEQANPGYSFIPLGENGYGHAFWQLETEVPVEALQNISTNLTNFLGLWGFYPTNEPPPNLWNVVTVQGFLQNEGGLTPHGFNIKRKFYIGFPDLLNGLRFTKDIYNAPPVWSGTGYNCVSAARAAGNSSGVHRLPWDMTPQNFGVTLIRMYPPTFSSDLWVDDADIFY